MNNTFKVRYKTNIYTQNTHIDRDGYTSIIFRNQGTEPVTVLAYVRLVPGESLKLKNDPGQIVDDRINVSFGTGNGTKELVVIRSYITEQ